MRKSPPPSRFRAIRRALVEIGVKYLNRHSTGIFTSNRLEAMQLARRRVVCHFGQVYLTTNL